MIEYIDIDLNPRDHQDCIAKWAAYTIAEIEELLAKHAAFHEYLQTHAADES